MIKFYKDTNYASLSAKGGNAICFDTNRHVILLDGHQFGKDVGSVYVASATSGAGYLQVPTGAVISGQQRAAGTLVVVPDNNSLWYYDGNGGYTNLLTPTITTTDFTVANKDNGLLSTSVSGNYVATIGDVLAVAENLESKVSTAYGTAAEIDTTPTNKVIVSNGDDGIAKSHYSLDNGSYTSTITGATAASGKNDLTGVLVNAKTLAEVFENVKGQAVTLEDSDGPGSGLITWTPQTNGITGTTWTPTFHMVETGSGALVNTADGIGLSLAIQQKATQEGYLATYGLFNTAAGQNVQLGADINLVKDQFLKGASYVRGVAKGSNIYEYLPDATAGAGYYLSGVDDSSKKLGTDDGAYPVNPNAANRYLKLTFALTKTDGTDTASDNDDIIYIDVNELFDSYTGIWGVDVNADTNQISGVVAPTGTNVLNSTEVGDTTAGKRGTHYQDSFLKVTSAGFAVSGIKQEITAYIQDISGVAASANTFFTNVGIGSNGELTGVSLSSYASGVNFSNISKTSGSAEDDYAGARIAINGTTVQDAFNNVSNYVAKLDYVFDGDKTTEQGGNKPADSDTLFIYRVEQIDGKISAAGKPLDSSNLKVTSFHSAQLSTALVNTVGIETVKQDPIYFGSKTSTSEQVSLQTALTSLVQSTHDAIARMDMNLVGRKSGTTVQGGTENYYAPDNSANTNIGLTEAYKVVNTVKQSDGVIYATDVTLDTNTVYFSGIAAVTGSGADARVAVDGINVNKALNSISNTIAKLDYVNAGLTGAVGQVVYTKPDDGTITYTDTLTSTYKIIRGVSQEDGLLSAVTMDLTDSNIQTNGISKVATGTATEVRAPIASGNVHNSIDSISNLIADYMSFHDASGNVI